MGCLPASPIQIYNDNKAVMRRSTHFDVRFHLKRQHVRSGLSKMVYKQTNKTKSLPPRQFEKLVELMMVSRLMIMHRMLYIVNLLSNLLYEEHLGFQPYIAHLL